eukprot:scaffold6708_cov134-Cylindrotheca_fusiformis.AAC.3
MAQLSFLERQSGQEALHGVSKEMVESKHQIDAWLTDLDIHLQSAKHGSVYEAAEAIDSSYVRDRDFRLSFLRSNRYNAKAAAKQILNFFIVKLHLFGREKLAKEITFSDLDEDDKDCLKNGCMQILATTDRAGRQILFHLPGLRSFKMLENELRARFFLLMCLWNSEETQRKGFVYVTYAIGRFQDKTNGAGFLETTRLILAFPLFVAGIHECTDHPAQYVIGRAAIHIMPPSFRARFKVHLGSGQECQYILSTFGIPRQALPLSPDSSKPKFEEQLVWYDEYRQWEESGQINSENSAVLPIRPRANDVLFVYGQKMTNRGNDLFRALAKEKSEKYGLGSSQQKAEISDGIINEVKSAGGRFLKQDTSNGLWVEVTLDEIRHKLRQMFRNYRRARSLLEKSEPSHFTRAIVITNDQLHPNDVLFGTSLSRNNQGNLVLRQTVKDLSTEYDTATRIRKTQLNESIVEQIKTMGGRFLKQSSIDVNHWEEMADDIARSKIAKLFRNNRRSQSKKKDFQVDKDMQVERNGNGREDQDYSFFLQ